MGQINFRIPDDLEAGWKREAKDKGLTFTELMHKKLGIKPEPPETPEKKVWIGAGYKEKTEEALPSPAPTPEPLKNELIRMVSKPDPPAYYCPACTTWSINEHHHETVPSTSSMPEQTTPSSPSPP